MLIRAQQADRSPSKVARRNPFVIINHGETCAEARIRHRRETGYLGKCVLVFA